jgi:DNA-binding transcriptional ArsR family regulator
VVNNSQNSLDAVFHALADPGRRQMIEALSRGEQTVGELAAPLSISLPAVSKHLGVLERAGLLRRRREGRRHHLSAVPEALQNASDWIENHRRFWEGSFDKLDQFLASQPDQKTP